MMQTTRGSRGEKELRTAEKGPGKGKCALLPGSKNPSASVVTATPNLNCLLGQKQCLPVETITLDVEELEDL